MSTVFVSLAVFIVLLVALVSLRARTGDRIDIKNADIVLALLPVALWLFLTGKIQELGFGEVKIIATIKAAAKEHIDKQVSAALPVEAVRTSPKGGTSQIGSAIENKSQALSFTLGRGNYYSAEAIWDYLDRLTQYPYLRYLVFNNADGTFFGLADARQIANILRNAQRPVEAATPPDVTESSHPYEQRSVGGAEPRLSAKNLADWLNSGAVAELATFPGFIAAKDALKKSTDRKEALQAMNNLDVQTIPVIDEQQKFAGTVDRSKLTASILTEIAGKIDKGD